ncbi:MAG TPA: hypothetical protein PKH54_04525 [Myxococcota bacterium]|nr:hypothetical protein [Myxococcota bacterium]HOA12968.1 hypothetical protein [Myxococcota bacterium]HOC99187.1 hypothetical protein [Myxococcota bacterium]HOH75911.1 hypothetical protein [Myxococcota bacterium]HPV03192.1 hypothetical protein [Myxococcota bacterium]
MKRPASSSIPIILLAVASSILAATGCTPSIGDACESSTDCDSNHVCDLSQTGGYCTISPCPRAGCPGGSVCVRFDRLSSWCMQSCSIFDYCRDDYRCVTDFIDCDGNLVDPFCNQVAGEPAGQGDDGAGSGVRDANEG